jgi:nitrite reductase/ring-hydroxylating ferredoxin subunit/uncharacterized membrane protein
MAPLVLADPGMSTNDVIRAIGDQEWIDAAASPLQEAVRKIITGPVKDLLHGKQLGHPLHPALTDVPIGAWTVAAIVDGIELARGKRKTRAADTAIKIGLAGAVASAVTGLTDWSETDGRAKRIGMTHGVLNLTAAGLYATSLLLRRRSRSEGIGVSMIGYAISMIAAFLGGHLSFGEQIGVDHTATPDQGKPEKFTAVMDEEKLPANKPTRAEADGVTIVLVRRGEEIFALRDTCAHLGGPLSEGNLEGDGIVCPWHGSKFCLADGHVLNGPSVFPERCFDVRVRGGKIEVRARQ